MSYSATILDREIYLEYLAKTVISSQGNLHQKFYSHFSLHILHTVVDLRMLELTNYCPPNNVQTITYKLPTRKTAIYYNREM
jgi:hypothetical protein